jgi:hypothetical protein
MTDFIRRYQIISNTAVLWAIGIITKITLVWSDSVLEHGLGAPSASLGVALVGLFGIAVLNLRKMRGVE